MILDAWGCHFGDFGHSGRPCGAQAVPSVTKRCPGQKNNAKRDFLPTPSGSVFWQIFGKNTEKQIQEGKGLQKTHQNQDPFFISPSNGKRVDFRPPGPSKTRKPLESECNVAKTTKYGPGSIFSQFWSPFGSLWGDFVWPWWRHWGQKARSRAILEGTKFG